MYDTCHTMLQKYPKTFMQKRQIFVQNQIQQIMKKIGKVSLMFWALARFRMNKIEKFQNWGDGKGCRFTKVTRPGRNSGRKVPHFGPQNWQFFPKNYRFCRPKFGTFRPAGRPFWATKKFSIDSPPPQF